MWVISVFHSRLVKVWHVKRLGVAGRVSIECVAVVQSVRLPRLLVLGKVPASGKFGFQSLWRIKHIKSSQVKKKERKKWKYDDPPSRTGGSRPKHSPRLSAANHWRCWEPISWQRESVESCCRIHLIKLCSGKKKFFVFYVFLFYHHKSLTTFSACV